MQSELLLYAVLLFCLKKYPKALLVKNLGQFIATEYQTDSAMDWDVDLEIDWTGHVT